MNKHVASILALLAGLGIELGRTPANDDDAVELARELLTKQRATQKATVELAEAGKTSTAGLAAILQALGVEDVGGATKKITEMLANSAALLEAMPELSALQEKQGADEDGDAEKDVGEAVAAHRIDPRMIPALQFMRTGGVALPKKDAPGYPAALKVALKARSTARAAFLAAYPKVSAAAASLLRPSGITGAGGAAPNPVVTTVSGEINLTSYNGRNRFERAIDAAIQLDKAAGGKLASAPWAAKCSAGRALLSRKDVVIVGGE